MHDMTQFFIDSGRAGGKIGGPKGGKARAEKLSPERRKEIAKKGALARWGKKKKAAKAKAKTKPATNVPAR